MLPNENTKMTDRELLSFLKTRYPVHDSKFVAVWCLKMVLLDFELDEKYKAHALERQEKRREAIRLSDKSYRSSVKGKALRAAAEGRRRALKAASRYYDPVEYEQLNAKYLEAALKTKETGVKWVVDHVVPLTGKNSKREHIVCGLHRVINVRVITEADNLTKGDKFEVMDA